MRLKLTGGGTAHRHPRQSALRVQNAIWAARPSLGGNPAIQADVQQSVASVSKRCFSIRCSGSSTAWWRSSNGRRWWNGANAGSRLATRPSRVTALMLAHAERGDRSRVAVLFQRCRQGLFNELGVEPSAATQRLYERLRRDGAVGSIGPGRQTAAVPPEDEAPAPGDSPFQGLLYFDEDDARRFFGRERLTARLVRRISVEPFLAVIGASGSGKSSLARAGLVPALRSTRDVIGAVRVMTPTAHPLEALGRNGDDPLIGPAAVSPHQGLLLAGRWDGGASLFSAATGKELQRLFREQAPAYGVAFSPDGSRFATGHLNNAVRMWDTSTRQVVWTSTQHVGYVLALAFSPDGTHLASASADTTARVWDVASGTQLLVLQHEEEVTSIAYSPDGKRLATATRGRENAVRLWSASTGELLRTLNGHQDAVWTVNFSPDGQRLVSASRDGTARIWNVETGEIVATLHSTVGALVAAAFSPDGQRLATAARAGNVELWDLGTERVLITLAGAGIGERLGQVTFTPDGRQLVVRVTLPFACTRCRSRISQPLPPRA
jgi:WD40 repeat protein